MCFMDFQSVLGIVDRSLGKWDLLWDELQSARKMRGISRCRISGLAT